MARPTGALRLQADLHRSLQPLGKAQTKNDAVGEVEWEVSVDDTVIRAHQQAADARSQTERGGRKEAPKPRRRCSGTQQRRFLYQAAPGLRRQGSSASLRGRGMAAPSLRDCSTRCAYRAWKARGASRVNDLLICSPTGLQSLTAPRTGHLAHPLGTQGPERRVSHRASETPTRFRPRGLPEAQRGR